MAPSPRDRRAVGPVLARLLTAAGWASLLVGLLSAPAAAHPFGAPPMARLTAQERTVTVRWSAAEDDLVALGHRVGAFDDVHTPAPSGTPRTAAVMLSASPAVANYIARGIAVTQLGRPCTAAPPVLDDLTGGGAVVSYACPQPVRTVQVRVSLLTDLHPAYRTVMLADAGATPSHAVATHRRATQTFTFGLPPARDPQRRSPSGMVGAALVVLGVGGVVRRRIVTERRRNASALVTGS